MKKTRLNAVHKEAGARMVEFAGFEMPIEYKGIIDEHLAVRTKAGLFDVSHMGEIIVEGPEALACLQYLTPNDVAKLSSGKIQYTALTTSQGTFVDDLLIYCLSVPDKYLLVVNAANIDKDFAWVKEKATPFRVKVFNRSDEHSQLALQGPLAREILQPLTDIDLSQMKPFTFAFGQVASIECLVSRTGYTGEDGFEIYTLAENPEVIWKAIMAEGEPKGLLPVGLGARDTLRLEAKLMLYGNDISDKTTVLEADLKWIVKFQKGDFIGKAALEKQEQEGLRRKLIGFEVIDKGIARPHYPVFIKGEQVSEISSGTFAPYLKKAIGLTYLPVEHTEIGTEFEIGVRDRKLKTRVVPTPFYKREKK